LHKAFSQFSDGSIKIYLKRFLKSKAKSPNSADSQKESDAQQNPALVY
jgi:hypothetical protein